MQTRIVDKCRGQMSRRQEITRPGASLDCTGVAETSRGIRFAQSRVEVAVVRKVRHIRRVLQRDLMMRQLVIVVVAIVMGGCGAGSTPTPSPSPVPAASAPAPAPAAPPVPSANIVSAGGGSWSRCTSAGACVFNGPMRNTGAGCAGSVRGTVTFNNAQNQPLGTYQWSITAMVRPDESFVFTTAPGAIPPNVSSTEGNYSVSPSWTDLRCP